MKLLGDDYFTSQARPGQTRPARHTEEQEKENVLDTDIWWSMVVVVQMKMVAQLLDVKDDFVDTRLPLGKWIIVQINCRRYEEEK